LGQCLHGQLRRSRRIQPSSEQRFCSSDGLRSRSAGRLPQLLASVCLRRMARLWRQLRTRRGSLL